LQVWTKEKYAIRDFTRGIISWRLLPCKVDGKDEIHAMKYLATRLKDEDCLLSVVLYIRVPFKVFQPVHQTDGYAESCRVI
jgi:hypothetical protein